MKKPRFIQTKIKNVCRLEFPLFKDQRGDFVKFYNRDSFLESGFPFEVAEIFYTCSGKDVIRGMHFQVCPYEQYKLVVILNGSITDVVLDLRKDSDTYRGWDSCILSSDQGINAVLIPPGIAHGFRSLTDNTMVLYAVSSVYSINHDKGIRWDSFGYDWQLNKPVLSERDRCFPSINDIPDYFQSGSVSSETFHESH